MKSVLILGMLSFFLSFLMGKLILPILSSLNTAQPIKDQAPPRHQDKKGVLTLGGLIIIFTTLIIVSLSGHHKWPFFFSILFFGGVGFIDDFIKLKTCHNDGLSGKVKLLSSMLGVLILVLWHAVEIQFYGIFYLLFLIFFATFSVHAVNLTDGIDGLCSTTSAIAFASLGGLALKQGAHLSTAIICATLTGALAAFLLFNTHPAKIILGDTGALALGGALVYVSLDLQTPLALFFIGFVFMLEGLSVILQVGYFKCTQKRLFKMAPFHHALELSGKSEGQIVNAFSLLGLFSTSLYFLFFVN